MAHWLPELPSPELDEPEGVAGVEDLAGAAATVDAAGAM